LDYKKKRKKKKANTHKLQLRKLITNTDIEESYSWVMLYSSYNIQNVALSEQWAAVKGRPLNGTDYFRYLKAYSNIAIH